MDEPNFREIAEKIVENWISHDKVYVGTFYGNLIENIEAALRQVYEQRPKSDAIKEIYSVGNKVSNLFFQSKDDAINYLNEYGTGSNGLYVSTIPIIANTKIKEIEND